MKRSEMVIRKKTWRGLGVLPLTILLLAGGSAQGSAQADTMRTRRLEEVSVTALSPVRKVETSGFSVAVIDPQSLVRYSLTTTEILDRLPGVKIRQSGGLGSSYNINLNGLSGNAVRTFINGIPQSNYGMSFSLRSIPSSMIKRIEVYKGVVPASLSEDALGGAINIILKEDIRNNLFASYSYGSFGTHQASLSGSYRIAPSVMASASAFYNRSDNSYSVWGEGIDLVSWNGQYTDRGIRAKRFHDKYIDYGGRASLSISHKPWADHLAISGQYSYGYKDIQHGMKMNRVYGNRHRHSHAYALDASYRKKGLLLEGLDLEVRTLLSRQTRQVVDTIADVYDWSGRPIMKPDGTPVRTNHGSEVRNALTGGASMQKDVSDSYLVNPMLGYTFLEDHSLRVNWLYNHFRRDSEEPLLPAGAVAPDFRKRSTKSVLSASYEALWLGERLRSNIFYKYYSHRHAGVSSAYNSSGQLVDVWQERSSDDSGYGASLSYRVLRDVYLLFSAERAIRMPSEMELFGNVSDNLGSAEQLRPEYSNNFNLGLSTNTIRLGKALSYNFGVTGFVRNVKDMIREKVVVNALADFTSYENVESILVKGFDATLFLSFYDRLNLSLSYSLFDARFNTQYDTNGAPYLYYKVQLPNEPSQKGVFNVAYIWRGVGAKENSLTLSGNLSYVNSFPVGWGNIGASNLKSYVPRQTPVDLGLSYAMPRQRLTFSFDAKNVFDQQLFDNYALQKPGRAFYGKITYTLH